MGLQATEDFSSIPFFIRRMDTTSCVRPLEVPEAHIPLIGFICVASVSQLLESVFNPGKMPGTIASYASEIGISENYLSRLVFERRCKDNPNFFPSQPKISRLICRDLHRLICVI